MNSDDRPDSPRWPHPATSGDYFDPELGAMCRPPLVEPGWTIVPVASLEPGDTFKHCYVDYGEMRVVEPVRGDRLGVAGTLSGDWGIYIDGVDVVMVRASTHMPRLSDRSQSPRRCGARRVGLALTRAAAGPGPGSATRPTNHPPRPTNHAQRR